MSHNTALLNYKKKKTQMFKTPPHKKKQPKKVIKLVHNSASTAFSLLNPYFLAPSWQIPFAI